MKKTKKLEIKKVTLRNLDESTLDGMAGATNVVTICIGNTCWQSTCPGDRTCLRC